MNYDANHDCEQCGMRSPRTAICETCEVSERYERRITDFENERDAIKAALGLMAGGTGLTLAQEVEKVLRTLEDVECDRDRQAARVKLLEMRAQCIRMHLDGIPTATGGVAVSDVWRQMIEQALGLEPDPLNHTIDWAAEVIFNLREKGNRT